MNNTTLNKQALLGGETLTFNNEHQSWEEGHELTVSFQSASWGDHFQLWLDGELVADPKSFSAAQKKAQAFVQQFSLVRA